MKKTALLFAVLTCVAAVFCYAQNSGFVFHPGVDYVDENNFLHITGSIENRTGKWICHLIVYFDLRNSSGSPLGAVSTLGESEQAAVMGNDVIAPNDSGYFEFIRDLSKVNARYGSYKVINYTFIDAPANLAARLDGVKTVKDSDGGCYVVSGTITNTGKAPCKDPGVVMIGCDGKGTILFVEQEYLGDIDTDVPSLAPGKSYPFECLTGFGMLARIATIKVIPGFSPMDD